jgi:two-component system phosphate regulon sensor histidine kinase PhoR
MVNLIENAVKYSNDGGTVTITAKKKEGKVYISVNDEGIGISQENLSRIFERFYRVDKSRSQKVGGTGLGLAIVKHIAALFEAEIQVESELGKGSTFTVIFKG